METRLCASSGTEFCPDADELNFYRTMGVPVPRLCPEERRRRRMAWATFRALHRRPCDRTGRPIVSMYPPGAKHPVYHSREWWADSWDACDYGRAFDFSRPFFEQFDELFRRVPAMHQSVIYSENCEYINMAGHCRNCYLSFYLDYCEDCYYLQDANRVRSSMDCLGLKDSELCYECVDCINCYHVLFSQHCMNCSDSVFLTDCRGCSNCIACANLVNKSFCVFNRPSSPEAIRELRASLKTREGIERLRGEAAAAALCFPKKHYFGHRTERSSGDAIFNVKNSPNCFNCRELENVKYGDYVFEVDNSMDITVYGNKSTRLYNCLKTGDQCQNNICCLCAWTGASDNAYCHLIINCKDCFGCSGLRHKNCCILNRPYARHEYDKLKKKITAHMSETGEWGEFFPMHLSPFAYNDTIAQDYYPLTESQALKMGALWREDAPVETGSREAIPTTGAREGGPLCAATGKPFKVIKAESELYRTLALPEPSLCPEERHLRRFALRNPTKLWRRHCARCSSEIATSYAPDRREEVFCEPCYQEALC